MTLFPWPFHATKILHLVSSNGFAHTIPMIMLFPMGMGVTLTLCLRQGKHSQTMPVNELSTTPSGGKKKKLGNQQQTHK